MIIFTPLIGIGMYFGKIKIENKGMFLMALIGFARRSTRKEDLKEQINTLEDVGCAKIIQFEIPKRIKNNFAIKLQPYINKGDVLVVKDLHYLGYSLSQIIHFLNFLMMNKVDFIALDSKINTTNKNHNLSMSLIHLVNLFADVEKKLIAMKISEGMIFKEKENVGRPLKISSDLIDDFENDVLQGKSLSELQKIYGASISTVYRARRKILKEKNINLNKIKEDTKNE